MTILERFKTRGYVDRKGLFDGLQANARMFDRGFCSTYDAAYNAGSRLRLHKQKLEREAIAGHVTAA